MIQKKEGMIRKKEKAVKAMFELTGEKAIVTGLLGGWVSKWHWL